MAKKIFLIAAEQSGDLLGSKLMRELKAQLNSQNESFEFIGIGGNLMKKEGLNSLFPMEELCVMGFVEVLPHIPHLLKRIKQTVAEIAKQRPDYIITIDAPDFSFRVMQYLQNLALRLGHQNVLPGKRIHLIAPSVWAYRAGRAKKISKLYDLLLAILPFEPPFFEKHGLKTVFVGHPLMDNSTKSLHDENEKQKLATEFRTKFSITENEILICTTPGSRTSEVKKVFPEFITALNILWQKYPQIKVAIPLVSKTRQLVQQMAQTIEAPVIFVEEEDKNSAFCATNFALAKSGTNAVEFSLYRIPTIVAYRVNWLTFILFKMVTKVKFANLVNLVANEEIVPEMLQNKCTGKQLAAKLDELINNKKLSDSQIAKSDNSLKIMGLGSVDSPSSKAAKTILSL